MSLKEHLISNKKEIDTLKQQNSPRNKPLRPVENDEHLDIQLEPKDIDVVHRFEKYTPNKNRPMISKCERRQT